MNVKRNARFKNLTSKLQHRTRTAKTYRHIKDNILKFDRLLNTSHNMSKTMSLRQVIKIINHICTRYNHNLITIDLPYSYCDYLGRAY